MWYNTIMFDSLTDHITQARARKYLLVAGDKKLATQLYLHQAIYASLVFTVIQHFEVFLRNKIDHYYTNKFQDYEDWLLLLLRTDSTNPWWDVHANKPIKFIAPTYECLSKTYHLWQNQFIKSGFNHNQLVADLSLGFWTSLFRQSQYKLLGDSLLEIFVRTPLNKISRREINNKLFQIKTLRNRIAHNEPIIFDKTSLNLISSQESINTILELTSKLSIDTSVYDSSLAMINQQKSLILQLSNQNPTFSAG